MNTHEGDLLHGEEPVSRELLVDVSVILSSDAHTGIQRVVRALLSALLERELDGYVVRPVFATRGASYAYAPVDAPLLAGRLAPDVVSAGAVSANAGDIFLALDLAANILPRHRRQIGRWRRNGCMIATIMYDLLPEQRQEWFNPKTRRHYRRWLRVVTKKSDRIICISQDVAEQLRRWVSARPWRGNARLSIKHIRLGGDIGVTIPTLGMPHNANALLDQIASMRTYMVVGTIEPRKGHACLLPAFEALWRDQSTDDVALVFVGRPGWRTDSLQKQIRCHPETGKRLFWFDDASDEFLSHLYGVVHGAIVPSLAEGFGLPLVEALSHNLPVLARDLPVFRSMNLKNVAYFSQDSPLPLTQSLKNWLDSISAIASESTSADFGYIPTWNDSLDDLLVSLSINELKIRPQQYSGIS